MQAVARQSGEFSALAGVQGLRGLALRRLGSGLVARVVRSRWVTAAVVVAMLPMGLRAQAPTPVTPAQHASGTVKSTATDSVTLLGTDGKDVTVSVPAEAKVLIVPPGSHDLKAATPGALSDVAAGDRVLATAAPGDTSTPMKAARLIVMKSTAIAQTHAEEDAAWQRGGGGIVKAVDTTAGTVTVVNGARTMVVKTTPATSIRRYANGSVKFQDAVASSLAAIHPGDQLRVRGTKSEDGSEIAADGIVTGNFQHFAGLISAIDPSAQTITLKDLATKKVVTVQVTPESNLKRLPPQLAQMIAGANKQAGSGDAPRTASAGAPGAGAAGPQRRPDLAQILPRLPSQTLGDLKTGEAVMIVANSAAEASAHSTAITLLVGVDPILAAPGGDSMTLSPWSVGGGEPEGGAQP
jgi:hypothetical protein